MFKALRKVSPTAGPSREGNADDRTGSRFLQSIASLTPSQLDQALMKMLKIESETSGIRAMCIGNPITKSGKRMQLLRMLGLSMIPVMVLLSLTSTLFITNIINHLNNKSIRRQIQLGTQISDLVHNLQNERDMSSLYLSSTGPDTKSFLVRRYPLTDASIDAMTIWPASTNAKVYFQTRDEFVNYLNLHRYQLDTLPVSQKGELEFYTNLISKMTTWFFDAVTEAQTGTVWKQLVALQHVIMAKESFGIERAYGNMYYARGGFTTLEEYLMFVDNQDVANYTLYEAKEYSSIVDEQAEILIEDLSYMVEIRNMRFDIRGSPTIRFPRNIDMATRWFDNMTFLIDALLMLQGNLTDNIEVTLLRSEKEDETLLLLLGLMMLLSMTVCPIILNAVYALTTDIQNYSITLADRTKALNREKKQTDTLLYQMIPKPIAEQLKMNQNISAELFAESSVFFSDIVGFTSISSRSSPIQVVSMLNFLYTCFDDRIQCYDVYKVETIGDAYMVASGVPTRNGRQHVVEIATMSLDILDHVSELEIPHMPGNKFQLRIGMHSGSVVAGVVGSKMPRYCLFGETVSIASRMESTGMAGRVHISDTSHNLLLEIGEFQMEPRKDDVQTAPKHGKGRMHASDHTVQMKTFWLLNRKGMVRSKNRHTPSSTSSSEYGDRVMEAQLNKETTLDQYADRSDSNLQTSYM